MADPAGRDLTARGAETRASEDNQLDRGSRFGPFGQPSVSAPSPSSGEGVVFLPGFTSHLQKGICETELTSLGMKACAAGGVRNGARWVIPFCALPDHTSHSLCSSILDDRHQHAPQLARKPATRVGSAHRRRTRRGNPWGCPPGGYGSQGGPVILSEAKNLHGVFPGS